MFVCVLLCSIIPEKPPIQVMKLRSVILAIALLLVAITIASAVSQNPTHALRNQGQEAEITDSWISYTNQTGLYEYGAQITFTNTQQQNVTLTNLWATITWTYRNYTWSRTYPLQNLAITAGGKASVDVKSGDIAPADFAYEPIGTGITVAPGGYLKLAVNQPYLGLSVRVNGVVASGTFDIEASHLRGPKPTTEELTVKTYSGPYGSLSFDPLLWDKFHYQPLQRGVLGTGKFPLMRVISGSSYNSVTVTTVTVRTITVLESSGPRVYTLTDETNDFDAAKWGSLGKDGDYVYFYGIEEDYLAANGGLYHVLQPTEVSAVKMLDPVEVAREVIVSRLGEEYVRRYFSNPLVNYQPGDVNNTHVVSFDYGITVGNYTSLQRVWLLFDEGWKLSDSVYIPRLDNLQPFNVTESQAKAIAVEAGVPMGAYGLEAMLGYSGDLSGSGAAYSDKYVWYVSSWIDPPSSNPRRNICAVIDPLSGVVYAVQQGGIASIG